MKTCSIKTRIAILYVVILGLILLVYSITDYLAFKHILLSHVDSELETKVEEIRRVITAYHDVLGFSAPNFLFAVSRAITLEGEHPSIQRLAERESAWRRQVDRMNLRKDYIVFSCPRENLAIRSANVPDELARALLEFSSGEKRKSFAEFNFGDTRLRAISASASFPRFPDCTITVATSLEPTYRILKDMLILFSATIPLILILSGFIGTVFASQIIRPVMELTRIAEKITHENLSERLDTSGLDLEMKYLACAFNDMIGRLEESFKYIAELNTQVAHELKTPLAIIRGEAEVALRKERSAGEYRAVIESSLREVDRMLRIMQDLFLLARLEYRTEAFNFEVFESRPFFEEIGEHARMLAESRKLRFECESGPPSLFLKGDPLHLRRLFFNLIDNAIKATPENGLVSLTVKERKSCLEISVRDTGEGIPEGDREKIFERFFRGHRRGNLQKRSAGLSMSAGEDRVLQQEEQAKNSSFSEQELSTGLGLSIASTIARVHGGSISVASEVGKGSIFTVRLPLHAQKK